MRISTKGQYAVLALADLVRNQSPLPVPLTDISTRQKLPLPYLEQLFLKLKKAGIVQSTRGSAGGYSLAQSVDKITILNIVEAVDETIQTTRCQNASLGCQGKSDRCLTHKLWDDLGDQISNYLKNKTLQDVLTPQNREASHAA